MPAALIAGIVLAVTSPPAATAAPATYVSGRQASKNVVILLHGGGWLQTSSPFLATTIANASKRFGRWGNRMVSVEYAGGSAGLADVGAVYDAERKRSPDGRICVYGESAGGHWGLLLAAERPGLDCVIAAAAPADLRTLRTEVTAYVRRAFGFAVPVFDPAPRAASMQAQLLLEYAANDPLVPASQGTTVAANAPHASTRVLRAGSTAWVHSAVNGADLRAARRAERRLAS
jgi:dienelactone hydrolase